MSGVWQFLKGISSRATLARVGVEGIWQIVEDRLPTVIYTGHMMLSLVNAGR